MTARARTHDNATASLSGLVARDARTRFIRTDLPLPVAANEASAPEQSTSLLVGRRKRQARRAVR